MTTRKDFIGASALLAATVPAIAQAQGANFADLGRKVAHKNLFAIRKVEKTSGLEAMESTLEAYKGQGTDQNSLLFAAVFYHGASILFGFDDTMWDKYARPLLEKHAGKLDAMEEDLQTALGDAKAGNPVRSRLAALGAGANARFFVCNNALHGVSEYIAKSLGISNDAVYADHANHLLPNVSIVPAGVWAVHAIQEHGFTLLHTT
jgi:intracellular sulfur oxidation DsrE/DsrF family protein